MAVLKKWHRTDVCWATPPSSLRPGSWEVSSEGARLWQSELALAHTGPALGQGQLPGPQRAWQEISPLWLARPGTNPDAQMCCFVQIHSLRMRLHQWNGHDYWRTLNDPRRLAGLNRKVDVGASSAKPNWSWCSRSWDRAAAVSIQQGLLTSERLSSWLLPLSTSLQAVGLELRKSGVEEYYF